MEGRNSTVLLNSLGFLPTAIRSLAARSISAIPITFSSTNGNYSSCNISSSINIINNNNNNNWYNSALFISKRGIIVPKQLKAYGGTFSQSIGERSDHLTGNIVLQSLSPSRTEKSPLLSKNVKTKTVTSFEDMLLCPELQDALTQHLHITTPSPIQQTSIEVILQRKDTVVAAPHGEGKTLAYLLPLYQNMIKDRDVYKIPLRERRPRMILLAPTRELISQLQHVCSKLDSTTGLRSISFTSRKRAKHHLSKLLKNTLADVIIMDPKIVLRLIRARRIFLDDIRYIAVDEADVLLSSQHDHDAVHLLMKIQKRVMFKYLWPVQTQTVFATSFITRKLEFVVGKKYPNAVTCMHRQRMHRPSNTLRHRFFAISREQEKMDVLQHILKKHGNQPRLINTDAEEIEAHTKPYYLSGTLEELIMYREMEEAKRRNRRMSSSSNNNNNNNNNDNDENNNNNNTNINEMIEKDQDQHNNKIIESEDENSEFLNSISNSIIHNNNNNNNNNGASPNKEELNERKEAARYVLEQIRPVHWEHLTTVAAPFTCHIPRTVFGPGQRCIIFTRGIDSTTAIFHHLRGLGFACSLLHAMLPPAVRHRHFADFASGRTNILCATDLAARGLDLHVDIIINFDMPTNALIYLSRVGRTARQGRLGRVYSLYTKQQGVIVSAVRSFLKNALPLEDISNWRTHMTTPRYSEWKTHKTNAIARAYVSLISQKTIPAHLERTYLKHNATWRPLFHPQTTHTHAGVPPRQQHKVMEAIVHKAVWFRRGQLAKRKGGRAKFGRHAPEQGVWNDIGGIASMNVANVEQSATPAGRDFGPPQGPPR